MAEDILASIVLAIWLYLIAARGGFWCAAERDNNEHAERPAMQWPQVSAIIPARDEAETVGETVASLLRQDYRGRLSVILVDDQSRDDTAARARDAAAALGGSDRLIVISGRALPPGWTGKLWAQSQGVEYGIERAGSMPSDYLLLTDADITYAPGAVSALIAHSQQDGLVLNSLMVKLRCKSFAERMFVPAFVFFFQMLYPFAWVNRRDSRMAAAAGGCMLVERKSLAVVGGIAAIRTAVIDDCTLGARLKTRGPIWLGLSNRAISIRPYATFEDIRHMVIRSAYAQLNYSALLLLGTVLGLAITYIAAPLIAVLGSGTAQVAGAAAWALMGLAYLPTLRFYRLSPLWAPLLPVIAAVYMGFTLDSAYQHMRGRGGMWKGRAQALPAKGR